MKYLQTFIPIVLWITMAHCGAGSGSKDSVFSSPGGYYTIRVPVSLQSEIIPATTSANFIELVTFTPPQKKFKLDIVVTENIYRVDPVQYSKFMVDLWDTQGSKVMEQQNITINNEIWVTFVVRESDGKWNFNANLVKPDHIIIVGWTSRSGEIHTKFTPRLRKILQTIQVP